VTKPIDASAEIDTLRHMGNTVTSEATPRERLARLIDEQGRRKGWVARQAGIHPAHLSKVLSGERRITPALARRLAGIFGVPTDTFAPQQEEGER
jgi:plasmid maintenance system antidote protein VapI